MSTEHDGNRTGNADRPALRLFRARVTLPAFVLVLAVIPVVCAIAVLLQVVPAVGPAFLQDTSGTGVDAQRKYGSAAPVATPRLGAAGETFAEESGEASDSDAWLASSGVANANALDSVLRRIIKDANLSVQVESFKDASGRAADICEAHGGYVQSSSAQASGDELRSGMVVLRVPADRFDAALREIEALGKVRSKDVSARDVTEEYVDLEARLANWQQQEKQLLAIMAKATKVGDVLAVQAELGRVREEIERITGRLKYLKSEIDFSTITAEFFEPAAVSEVPRDWGFVRALERALAAFVNTVNAVVVVAGAVAPVIVLALAAWALVSLTRGRRRTGRSA